MTTRSTEFKGYTIIRHANSMASFTVYWDTGESDFGSLESAKEAINQFLNEE